VGPRVRACLRAVHTSWNSWAHPTATTCDRPAAAAESRREMSSTTCPATMSAAVTTAGPATLRPGHPPARPQGKRDLLRHSVKLLPNRNTCHLCPILGLMVVSASALWWCRQGHGKVVK
jgi:hypothetical protein